MPLNSLKMRNEKQTQSFQKQNRGRIIKKDKIFQAKERFLELKSEHEQVILSREKKMGELKNVP